MPHANLLHQELCCCNLQRRWQFCEQRKRKIITMLCNWSTNDNWYSHSVLFKPCEYWSLLIHVFILARGNKYIIIKFEQIQDKSKNNHVLVIYVSSNYNIFLKYLIYCSWLIRKIKSLISNQTTHQDIIIVTQCYMCRFRAGEPTHTSD